MFYQTIDDNVGGQQCWFCSFSALNRALSLRNLRAFEINIARNYAKFNHTLTRRKPLALCDLDLI